MSKAVRKQGFFGRIASRITRASPDGLSDKKARSIIEELGYSRLSKHGVLYLKDGKVARYLQVGSTDLSSIDQDTRRKYEDAFTAFNRIYTGDYKITVIASRIDTSKQQQYWRKLRVLLRNQRTKQDQLRGQMINEYLAKAISQERDAEDFSDINFYLEIFGNNSKDLRLNTNRALMAGGLYLNLQPISKKETEEILFRLNNLNSK